MAHVLKNGNFRAGLAVLAGALLWMALLTGALLITRGPAMADEKSWHHKHLITASTKQEAKGKCASGCSTQGHSEYRVYGQELGFMVVRVPALKHPRRPSS